MKTSSLGINLIKQFEGFRAKAYLCPAGVPTIGYGTIKYPGGGKVALGDVCNEEQATQYLQHDVSTFEKEVERLTKVPLSQEMFDALVCFTYNLGSANLGSSTLLRLLNLKEYAQVPPQFLRWSKAGGKVLPGLVKRRRAEAELFREGIARLP